MMTMQLDGAAILAAIAKDPATFGMSAAQVNGLAMASLLARFKDKTVGLDRIKAIAKTIGADDFRLALDHVPARDLASLVKRLDSRHPDLKTASETWYREHAWNLSDGGMEPTVGTSKATRSKASQPTGAGSKTGPAMKSKALMPKVPAKTKTPRAPSVKKAKQLI